MPPRLTTLPLRLNSSTKSRFQVVVEPVPPPPLYTWLMTRSDAPNAGADNPASKAARMVNLPAGVFVAACIFMVFLKRDKGRTYVANADRHFITRNNITCEF